MSPFATFKSEDFSTPQLYKQFLQDQYRILSSKSQQLMTISESNGSPVGQNTTYNGQNGQNDGQDRQNGNENKIIDTSDIKHNIHQSQQGQQQDPSIKNNNIESTSNTTPLS